MKTVLAIVGFAPNALGDLMGLFTNKGVEVEVMVVGLDAAKRMVGSAKYVVTNHLEDIPAIKREIQEHGGDDPIIISAFTGAEVDIAEPYDPPEGHSGSSAMTGTLAAIRMGYEKIVLCGCPLTGNAPEGNPYEAFRLGWEDKKGELIGKVKSMSGWTMDLLGYPTEEWLNE